MRLVILSAVLMVSPTMAATSSDLRDYALAACLTRQTASPALRDEGCRLAGIVLARAAVSPLAWHTLQQAMEADLARQSLLMVHADGPVAQSTQPAPLASCLRVIDSSPVRRAMARLAPNRR